MTEPRGWRGTAFNTSPNSANKIHSDAMARSYGFRGGLVPGVAVSAYLTHPAVEAWGLQWLNRGGSRITVHNPSYHGDGFAVDLDKVDTNTYSARLSDSAGTVTASGEVFIAAQQPQPPTLRGDPLLDANYVPPPATPRTMQQLRNQGMRALQLSWQTGVEMESYLADPNAMPALHAPGGPGYANAAFLLGLSNWVLAANVVMNPWIHLQTEAQHYCAVTPGTQLTVECDIHDLFSRKGHEFVDLNVNVFTSDDARPVIAILLRAIYQVRPVAE